MSADMDRKLHPPVSQKDKRQEIITFFVVLPLFASAHSFFENVPERKALPPALDSVVAEGEADMEWGGAAVGRREGGRRPVPHTSSASSGCSPNLNSAPATHLLCSLLRVPSWASAAALLYISSIESASRTRKRRSGGGGVPWRQSHATTPEGRKRGATASAKGWR